MACGFLIAILAITIVGAIWALVVEVRHALCDAEFCSVIRVILAPFRSMGQSLGHLWETGLNAAQVVLWPKKEEERNE